MSLLAIELESLNSAEYVPIIKQTLENDELRLYIVIYLTPELRSKLDSPAKRAGHFQRLQELISALYICTASKTEISCDVIFADWCGYSLEEEVWEYSVLNIPECMSIEVMRLIGSIPWYCHSTTAINFICTHNNLPQ
jgi:hypothetical protein